MSRVSLMLESPLMVGGKRIKDNVLESLDYIPGHVLRAAFAKYILLNCPLYDPLKTDPHGRYNYVYIRDEYKCGECSFNSACSYFSNIKFSFFYPSGFSILPYTAKKCKYHNNHGFLDILTNRSELKCRECMNKDTNNASSMGRMESVSGFRRGREKVSVSREVFTRTAIDPYTKTAREGSLYSIYAVKPGIIFEGEIEGFEKLNVSTGQVLRVGSYNTVGFGKMKIQDIKDKLKNKDMAELLKKFNDKMHRNDGKTYIPMLLISDAKLGIEECIFNRPLCNSEYRQEWKKLIFKSDEDIEIEHVYGENDIYRGYDTSMKWGKWERKPIVITLKGTTILMSTKKPMEYIIPLIENLEKYGIGRDTLNGFGQVEICNELHVEGEI